MNTKATEEEKGEGKEGHMMAKRSLGMWRCPHTVSAETMNAEAATSRCSSVILGPAGSFPPFLSAVS